VQLFPVTLGGCRVHQFVNVVQQRFLQQPAAHTQAEVQEADVPLIWLQVEVDRLARDDAFVQIQVRHAFSLFVLRHRWVRAAALAQFHLRLLVCYFFDDGHVAAWALPCYDMCEKLYAAPRPFDKTCADLLQPALRASTVWTRTRAVAA
jgi:hypothetical protein